MAESIDDLQFEHSFAALPASFYTCLEPVALPAPYLVGVSKTAAALIGLDPALLGTERFIQAFSGNRIPPTAKPLAQVYSGHQFGVWAGQLGDGRALLLGDLAAPACAPTGRLEVQLKGSGPTPYSRMADGRAVLRSSIREFLCSEAMAALGIPTSRGLCVIGSDSRVMREQPETTAVLTRLAPSFVRFGSFEHWFYGDRREELKTLADYVIDRFYPALRDDVNPYQALLREVTLRTAHLIAQWQAVGFMHGVMNTDNMSILGLTLDYGPYGFMEAFSSRHICNHTDQGGRYAYIMQPQIGRWNCFALGQVLLPLIGSVEDTQAALEIYQPEYAAMLDRLLHAKLGLSQVDAGDDALLNRMFALMEANHVDFTRFFRLLGELQIEQPASEDIVRNEFIDRPAYDAWAAEYRQRLRREQSCDQPRRLAMHAVNPKYILRNYLAQVAIEKAQHGDYSEVAKLLDLLNSPFTEQPEQAEYASLPPDWASHLEVSCSS